MNKKYLITYCVLLLQGLLHSAYTAPITMEKIRDFYQNGDFVRCILAGDSMLYRGGDSITITEQIDLKIIVASSYGMLGETYKAYDYTKSAIELSQLANDSLRLTKGLINLAGIHYFTGDQNRAYKTIMRAMRICKTIQNTEKRMELYMALTLYHVKNNQKDSAAYYSSNAYYYFKNYNDERCRKALINYGLYGTDTAAVLQECKEFLANSYFLHAAPSLRTITFVQFASIFSKLNRQMEVERMLDSASRLYHPSMGVTVSKEYYHLKYQIEDAKGNTENALKALKKYNFFLQKLDSMSNLNGIMNAEKIALLEAKQSKIEHISENLKTTKTRYFTVLIFSSVSIVLLSLIVYLYIKTAQQAKRMKYLANNREQMMSVLSHDIRSPLSQISSILDMMQDNLLDAEEQEMVIDKLSKSTKSTLQLLENTVKWIQLNNQHLTPKPELVDVSAFAQELTKQLKPQADDKEIKIDVQLGYSTLQTDPNLLENILRNVLTNAIKFSHKKSHIDLVFNENERGQYVLVRDYGTGMSNEQRLKLLNKEIFSTQGTRKERGSGLGMAIIHNACDLLRAEIDIESEPGAGTSFYVYL
ncbi:hypothetical protein GC194_14750 [bacterium]|nr:hypothetical protein [bacterium]